jgi:hypothetical protein
MNTLKKLLFYGKSIEAD